MGKLHELLAVEGDLKARAQQRKGLLLKLFTEGLNRFQGKVIIYQVNEGEDERPTEISVLGTTVNPELALFREDFGQWLDVVIQKETSNQDASADVLIDDKIVLKAMPATALLNLESKLAEIKSVYEVIPIYDSSERWEWDDGREIYISTERETPITKKVADALVLQKPTKEHPAQTQAITKDIRTGMRITTLHSGMMSPKEKRERLVRLDILSRAVKQARQRANNVEVTNVHITDKIFAFIEGVDL